MEFHESKNVIIHAGKHCTLYEDRMGTARVLHLNISKTPRERGIDDIAGALVTHLKSHDDRFLLYVKHVCTEELDVVGVPAMLRMVQHITDVGDDTLRRMSGCVFQVKEINELVRAAKNMFCALHNIPNFELVVDDMEASNSLQKFSEK